MTIESLRTFFAWCTLINVAFFTFWALFCIVMPDFVYRTQTAFFNISRDEFTLAMYRFLAQYKLLIIFLNFTPYIVLRMFM